MFTKKEQYIHAISILLLLPVVSSLLIIDLSKSIYRTLLFPSYGHIYVARILNIDFLHAFKQLYIPIVPMFISVIECILNDYITATSLLHFIYKYLFIIIWCLILFKILKTKKLSTLLYISAAVISSAVFIQALRLSILNFSILYFVPHSLMLILIAYIVYDIGTNIHSESYKRLASALTAILVVDCLYLLIYHKIYSSSIFLPLLLIITMIVLSKIYGSNFMLKYRPILYASCILVLIHPLEAIYVLVITLLSFYVSDIMFNVIPKARLLPMILISILITNLCMIHFNVNINMISYLLTSLNVHEISHLFTDNAFIISALKLQYNILLVLLCFSTLLGVVTLGIMTKEISMKRMFNIILFEHLFLLFIILNQADFFVRYLHHIVIVITMTFIIILIESIEIINSLPRQKMRKYSKALTTVSALLTLLGVLLYVHGLLCTYNTLKTTYDTFSTITGELGELSQAEIDMIKIVNSMLHKFLGPPKYTYENIETKYGKYQPIVAYSNVIVISDPYTALLLQKTLLLKTYFTPIFVIPNEYSSESLETMFFVKNVIKNVVMGNITSLSKVGNYEYYLLILSERTAYYLANDKCLFVFLPKGNPFRFYKFNCIMKRKYYINLERIVSSIRDSKKYDLMYIRELTKNDFYVYIILVKRRSN